MKPTTLNTDRTAEVRTLLSAFIATTMCYDTFETLRLLQREDLSMPRMCALTIVERRGVVSISDISESLNLSLGNTSLIVDKLVCHGYVTRVEDAQDRRQKLVSLTEKGQALVEELRAMRIENAVQRMGLLPPDLLNRTMDVLSEVTAQLSGINPELNVQPA